MGRLSRGTVWEAPSTLTVERDVEVMSRLTGILEEMRVDRGARVVHGQVLARLENRDLLLTVASQEKTYRLAQSEFERAKQLLASRVISEQEYDVRRWTAEKAKADWELAQAEAEKSVVRAPFDGVVTERYGRIGQRVIVDGNTPLLRITALRPLLARFYLPEAMLNRVKLGDSASIRTSADPGPVYEARIRWISPVIDAASGTFQVLAEVRQPEGDKLLRPGLSAIVHLAAGTTSPPLSIRRSALADGETLEEGARSRLFVVEGGRAVLRPVQVGRVLGEEVEILSGVKEGDAVIRNFPEDLADGERVISGVP